MKNYSLFHYSFIFIAQLRPNCFREDPHRHHENDYICYLFSQPFANPGIKGKGKAQLNYLNILVSHFENFGPHESNLAD